VRDDEQMERLLCSGSRGLLEIVMRGEGEEIVQFIHESLRNLLEYQNGLQILDPSIDETAIGKGHDQLTKSCINYISIEELLTQPVLKLRELFQRSDEAKWHALLSIYPFLDYALNSWPYHASIAESKDLAQTELVERFRPMAHIWLLWKYFWILQRPGRRWEGDHGPEAFLLHISSEYNIRSCVEVILDSGVSVNTLGGF